MPGELARMASKWRIDGVFSDILSEKLEISPVWGKLEIKFPVRTKETEAIMVLQQ